MNRSAPTSTTFLTLASTSFSSGRLAPAMAHLRRALAYNPTMGTAIALLALCARLTGAGAAGQDEGRRLANRLALLMPVDPIGICTTLAQYHAATGRQDAAASAWKRAVTAAPDQPLLLLMMAMAGLQAQSVAPVTVSRLLGRITLIDPANARFRHVIADVAKTMGKPAWTEQQAKAALLLDPSVSSGWTSLALAHEAEQLVGAAERAARLAVTVDPQGPVSWDVFIHVASRNDVAACARVLVGHLRTVLTKPDIAVAHLNVLRQAGLLDVAEGWIKLYFRTFGLGVAGLWGVWSDVALAKGDRSQAQRYARRELMLAPEVVEPLGRCYVLTPTADRRARLRHLKRLIAANAPGLGAVYQAISSTDASALDPQATANGVRDLVDLAADAASATVARTCLFLAAMLSPEDALPLGSVDETAELNRKVGDDLAIFIDEVRSYYIHRRGSFRQAIPALADLRVDPRRVEDRYEDGLSIIVPTGNRLFDLSSVLDSYVPAIERGTRFIFSVFADREGTAAYLRRQFGGHPMVTIVETDTEHFSKAAAVNVASGNVRTRFMLMLDCDCRLVSSDSAATILDYLKGAPDDIRSVDYRGMVALRHALFADMAGFPRYLVDAQIELRKSPLKDEVETDDYIIICEFLMRYQTRYRLWTPTRMEAIEVSDGAWMADMQTVDSRYRKLIDHFGEHRVYKRNARDTYLQAATRYLDQFMQRGRSSRLDVFLTKMRRFIQFEAQARTGNGSL